MKTYSSYINNFDNSALVISKLRKSNKKFSKFCDKQMENPESRGQSLESFLIMPVQRIPRYTLLLRELIKNSVASDPDFPLLEAAFNALSEIADSINTNKKDAESSEKVFEIQENLIGLSHPIVSPSRRFVKEGVLNYLADFKDMAKFDKTKKRRTVYLFNDLLVTAKGDKKLYITNEFPLSDIRVDVTKSGDYSVMVITYGSKVCAYTDGDGGDMAEWAKTIIKEKSTLEEKRQSFLR